MSPPRPGDPDAVARIHAADTTFDADDAALLRAVAETGSLNAAATRLGRSYSRAHARLTTLETEFGPLVDSVRGGADGGGTTLTAEAESLLARFDRLRAALTGHATADETVFDGHVTDRVGDLATVATGVGDLQAVAPHEHTHVEIGVRADAVTLHAPDDAPGPTATSARNRFSGTVKTIDAGDGLAVVTVDIGATGYLSAFVTATSVDTLELEPGTPVVASFKATATRGTPRTVSE